MREFFGLLCGAIAALAAFSLALAWFHDWAKRKGWAEGYEMGHLQGRDQEIDWILKLEREVILEREKIWREEG